jgi:hypothetical protein
MTHPAVVIPILNRKLGAVTWSMKDKPFLSDYKSTQPCPIKVMDQILHSNNRADEKALEIAKTGKVTTVVAVMHLYGDTESNLITTNAKYSAKKTKIGSNLKKLGLN